MALRMAGVILALKVLRRQRHQSGLQGRQLCLGPILGMFAFGMFRA